MTTDDRHAFAELLIGIGETYGEAVSDARMEIYYRALEDLSLDAIRHAATVHVRTQKFFPRPVELREAIDGSMDDRAELAWGGLLRVVRSVGYYGNPTWTDLAMERAAMELYGGWKALCERLPAEGPGLIVAAKQFKATYAAYARREARADVPVLPAVPFWRRLS
jgi:hypothetical protein